jgi:hypothetical protein
MPLGPLWQRWRYAAMVFACALCAACILLNPHSLTKDFLDAKAFACAGKAFAQGLDPYRDAAVRPCETQLGTYLFAGAGHFDQPTVPVPWAPYAMPVLALLTLPPFAAFITAWTIADFLCLAIAADLLRRTLPALSPVSIAAFVLFAGVPTEAILGQPVGFEVLAVAGAGAALRARSIAGCTIALLATSIWPYVALPLGLAMLAAGSRARRAALIAAAVVAVVTLVFVRALSIEYVTQVVPAHARSAVLEFTQLSLTSMIGATGTAPGIASTVGLVVYAATLGAGLWAAPRFARAARSPDALLWIPTMLATLGAPFLHFQELACALPGVLLVLSLPQARAVAWSTAIGAFVPWLGLILQIAFGFAIAPFGALMAWGKRAGRAARVALAAIVLFVLDLAVAAFAREHVINPHAYIAAPSMPNALAEESWLGFIAVSWHALGIASLAARGLSVLCATTFAVVTIVVAVRLERTAKTLSVP